MINKYRKMNCTHKRALKILYRNNPGFKKIRFSSNQFKKKDRYVLLTNLYIKFGLIPETKSLRDIKERNYEQDLEFLKYEK